MLIYITSACVQPTVGNLKLTHLLALFQNTYIFAARCHAIHAHSNVTSHNVINTHFQRNRERGYALQEEVCSSSNHVLFLFYCSAQIATVIYGDCDSRFEPHA